MTLKSTSSASVVFTFCIEARLDRLPLASTIILVRERELA
jgi:hypothetical protein